MPCECKGMAQLKSKEDLHAALAEVTKLTRMLCYLRGNLLLLPEETVQRMTNKQIDHWWEEHNSNDVKRVTDKMYYDLIPFPTYIDKQTLVNRYIDAAEVEHPVSGYHRTVFFPSCAEEAMRRVREKRESEQSLEDRKNAALSKLSDEEKEVLGL